MSNPIVLEIIEEIINKIIDGVDSCPICFETISQTKNTCSTPCGHVFCFTCMVKVLNTSNTCPCCRFKLNDNKLGSDDDSIDITGFINSDDEEDEYDSDDEDVSYDDSDDEEDTDGSDNEGEGEAAATDTEAIPGNADENRSNTPPRERESNICSIENVEKHFKDQNISYLEVLSVLFYRFPQGTSKRMKRRLETRVYNMVEFLDNEHIEQKEEMRMMMLEDIHAV